MHVNQSLLEHAVFKVPVFRFDGSVKTSSPLLNCRVKAKFHYASWFKAGLELVRSWFEAGSS